MRIGIDVGATTIKAALCAETGEIIRRQSVDTIVGQEDAFLKSLSDICSTLCQEQGIAISEILQIGIGMPGSLDIKNGVLLFGTNLGLSNVNLRAGLQAIFSCPIKIENDANCAALGESTAGAGRGMPIIVVITLGTGIGGGIVMNGKLFGGCNDIASELGHMVIKRGGLKCNCGRKGCFEMYASASAFVRRTQKMLAKRHKVDSILREGELTGKRICDAIDAGDFVAKKAFDRYVKDLTCGVANIVNILQPDCIVIGGGLSNYGEKLIAPVRNAVARETFRCTENNTQIVQATLGNDAGLIGAAFL